MRSCHMVVDIVLQSQRKTGSCALNHHKGRVDWFYQMFMLDLSQLRWRDKAPNNKYHNAFYSQTRSKQLYGKALDKLPRWYCDGGGHLTLMDHHCAVTWFQPKCMEGQQSFGDAVRFCWVNRIFLICKMNPVDLFFPDLLRCSRISFLSGSSFARILATIHSGDLIVALMSLRRGSLISLICLLRSACFVLGIFFFIHSLVARINPYGISCSSYRIANRHSNYADCLCERARS